MSLSNADFRKMVETTPRAQRFLHPLPDQSAIAPKAAKKKKKGSDNRKFKYQKKKKDDPEEEEEEEKNKYRDRAKEMREGINPDYQDDHDIAMEAQNMDMETTKFLGGTRKHTHMVKGLDFVLLSRIRDGLKREDDHKLEEAVTLQKTSMKKQQAAKKEKKVKSLLARRLNGILFGEQKTSRARKIETFLPGRMIFEFDLDTQKNNLPTTMYRSREDCPSVEETITGKVDKNLLKSIRKALHYARSDRKMKHKQKVSTPTARGDKKAKSHQKHDHSPKSPSSKDSGTKNSPKSGTKSLDEPEEEDIFGGYGEYVFQPKVDKPAPSKSSHHSSSSSRHKNSSSSRLHHDIGYGEDSGDKRMFLDGRHHHSSSRKERDSDDYHSSRSGRDGRRSFAEPRDHGRERDRGRDHRSDRDRSDRDRSDRDRSDRDRSDRDRSDRDRSDRDRSDRGRSDRDRSDRDRDRGRGDRDRSDRDRDRGDRHSRFANNSDRDRSDRDRGGDRDRSDRGRIDRDHSDRDRADRDRPDRDRPDREREIPKMGSAFRMPKRDVRDLRDLHGRDLHGSDLHAPKLGGSAQVGLNAEERAELHKRMREGPTETEEEDPFGFAALPSADPYSLDLSVGTGYDMDEDSDEESGVNGVSKKAKKRKLNNAPSKQALARMEKRKLTAEWDKVSSMIKKKR